MKVLHLISSMDPKLGGVSQAVSTMVKGLNALGVINHIISLDDPNEKFLTNQSIHIIPLEVGVSPWNYSLKLLPWLKKNLHKYDTLIVHGLWQYNTYAAYSAWKKVKRNDKVVLFVMPHGMLDPYFQSARGRRWKAMRNWFFWKLLERKIVNNGNGLLFTCKQERNLASKTFYPYKPKKELVVGLGVEAPPIFSDSLRLAFKEKCPDELSSPYLLFISRLNDKKGVDMLIEAYLSIKENTTLLPKLVIAGPGLNTSFGETLLSLAKGDKDIIFTGMLQGDAKWGAFYGCEAFILPSHQENFGIAVVEALACGKPVLISNQVNIWREIIDEEAGLVAADTLDGVKTLLTDWTMLPQMKKEMMGQQAERAYKKHFFIEHAAQKMKDAIAGVVSNK